MIGEQKWSVILGIRKRKVYLLSKEERGEVYKFIKE